MTISRLSLKALAIAVAVAAVAGAAEQVIITAAVPEDIPAGVDATHITIGLSEDDNGRMSMVAP